MTEMKPLIVRESPHSEFSFSASYRWLNCTGSINQCRGAVEGPPSVHAQEGRAAHGFAEACLRKGWDPMKMVGLLIIVMTKEEKSTFTVTPEMAEAIDGYLKFLKSLAGKKDVFTGAKEFWVEKKVTLGFLSPKAYGTADYICLDKPSRVLHVVDLKYGKGLEVDAVWNTQMMLYALAAIYDLGVLDWVKKVALHIYQPRTAGPAEKNWEISLKDLLFWARTVLWAAFQQVRKNPTLKCGPWCKWCRAKTTCIEWHAWQQDMRKRAAYPFAPVDFSPKQLATSLDIADDLEDWIKSLRQVALQRAVAGEIPEGWNLKPAATHRRWAVPTQDVETWAEAKGLEVTVKKLASPAQVEKMIRKRKREKDELLEEFEKMVEKPEGLPRLVRETPRETEIRPRLKTEGDKVKTPFQKESGSEPATGAVPDMFKDVL